MPTLINEPQATVLAVDDDDRGRELLAELLRGNGFLVWEARTGGEALLLARRQPDVVVLDVGLPDRDGFAVCREIRCDPDTATIPILMMSGFATNTQDRVLGLEGGADAFLAKPVVPEELVAYVRTLLRVRQVEAQAIAARKQAEEERERVAASERRLRTIIEAEPACVKVLDRNGIILDMNTAGLRMIEAESLDQIRGASVLELIAPEHHAALLAHLARTHAGRPGTARFDLITRRGTRRTMETHAVPFHDENDEATGVLAITHDITERLRLEAQYLQAQKMEAFGQLAGGVAHDFNNLLTVINGYSEVLLSQLAADEAARELVEEIKKAGERAASLTRQLLALSRKQITAPRLLDLNVIVGEMEKMLHRIIGEDIELVTKLDPAPCRVKADSGQIEQVLLNLAVNARDAMPRGGKLTIETRHVQLDEAYSRQHTGVRPGHYVRLSVSDNGIGMSKEILPRIFEPFFTTKEVGKGTGLGLPTVYGIVKQAGGHIEVYSEPGLGTTFKILLPRVEGAGASSQSFHGLRTAPGGTETILLVEDDHSVRTLSVSILEGCGYTVLSASGGAEALRLCRAHEGTIHLLMTDVVMPGMSGRELAEQALALRTGLRILYLSGYTDDAVVRHGILEQQFNFLQKPFTLVGLAQKVREVLDARR
jgi:PAS domain S-box-containing protein